MPLSDLSPWLRSAAGLLLAGVVLAAPASAQDSTPAASMTNDQLLTDFIHYVKIDRADMAASFARALLDRGLSPEEFVGLVEDAPQASRRFDDAIRDAMRDPDLESVAGELFSLFEQGRRNMARDPNEITRNITLLGESQRARALARERLVNAGEYAGPQLIEAVANGRTPVVQAEAGELLTRMGAAVVQPLCAALVGAEPVQQERIASILGRIGAAEAAPYLVEVAGSTSSDGVRTAAIRALEQIGVDPGVSAASLYVALGEAYYSEPANLTRFEGEEMQLVWRFDPGLGIFATPVRTEVFHEIMAMRLAEHALDLDPAVDGAAPLWLAANLSREIDGPDAYDNPLYPSSRRTAGYYAVAAGPDILARVLNRALDDSDTPLARRVIEAMGRSVGAEALASSASDDSALVRALVYPDRRVRFEAALVLAAAQPRAPFAGSDRVVPILASAIRDAGVRYTLVVTDDLQRRQELAGVLTNAGFVALAPAASLDDAAQTISEASGVDLIVTDQTQLATESLVSAARQSARLGATPVLALLPQGAYSAMVADARDDLLLQVVRRGISSEQIAAAANALADRALGPAIGEVEAEEYALRTLNTLRDLAISGTTAFDIADAARPLVAALSETSGEVRASVADVLAHIRSSAVQEALMDAALDDSGEEQVMLFARVADSARRFGAMLPERQIRRLLEVAESADEDQARAAAALLGALNLPGDRLAPMIVGAGER